MTDDQQIRVEALNLAIRANSSNPISDAERYYQFLSGKKADQ